MNTNKELSERYFGFPEGLTYQKFLEFDVPLRRAIICRNRVIQTDTYNRTMDKAKGEDWKKEETYVLQLRKAPHDYLITTGIADQIKQQLELPITQSEVDFAAEFFARQANIKYFNKEKWDWVVREHNGILPLKIDGLPDGTAILKGDPILRITGPGELAAHFEPDLHRVFYPSLVASDAHEIAMLIGKNRFIEAGMRGTATEEDHLIGAEAMFVGGGLFLTSDDAAAACFPELKDSGTLAHRFLAYKSTEKEALVQAITSLEKIAPVVDLNNSLEGIETVLELKKEFRHLNKPVWMRMDSGDVAALAIHALNRLKECGFTDPVLDKVAISDVESIEEMVEIDSKVRAAGFNPEEFIVYVAGELLMGRNKTRNVASSGFKLSRHLEMPSMKTSDSPGKESHPGDPTLVSKEGKRIVAQNEEFPGNDLFIPLYRPEKGIVTPRTNLLESRTRAERTYEEIKLRAAAGERSGLSPRTQKLAKEVADRYESNRKKVTKI